MLGIGLLFLAIGLFLTHRYYYALLIFFGFVTNAYQLIPPGLIMAGAPTNKLTDLALIFLLVALVSRANVLRTALRREQVFKWVSLFVAFVALDGFYSVWEQGYEFGSVLRVFRVNLFLLSFGIFLVVPVHILTRLFHTIAVLTVIQSAVFLIQIPLNQTLLNSTMAGSEVATSTVEHSAFIRFYNTPVFLTPVLFYYLFVFQCRSRIMHRIVLAILLLTVIAPLHRTYIFSIVVTASIYVLFRQSRSQRAFYIAVLLLVGYGVSMIDVVSSRLEEGVVDFQKTFTTGQSLVTTDYGTNTFAYRMAHLFERVNYVTQKPGGYVFGIGLLSEDAKQAEKLSFEVGAYDDRMGRKAQINTGDIAWSLLILQLGFVGTTLFVVMISMFIRFFYKYRSIPIAAVGLLTVAAVSLISFAGTELLMIPFRTLMVLLAVIVTKELYKPFVRRYKPKTYETTGLSDTALELPTTVLTASMNRLA